MVTATDLSDEKRLEPGNVDPRVYAEPCSVEIQISWRPFIHPDHLLRATSGTSGCGNRFFRVNYLSQMHAAAAKLGTEKLRTVGQVDFSEKYSFDRGFGRNRIGIEIEK